MMNYFRNSSGLQSKRIIFAVICIVALIFSPSFCNSSYGAQKTAHQYIPVLMYHHFLKFVMSDGSSGVTITTDKFRKDMEYLADNDFQPLLPKDLIAISEGTMKMPKKPIVITFDDGYKSAYSEAFPILKETGMKATVFVIVGRVENEGRREIPKLTWKEMREMYNSGIVDIQSHSYNLHNSYNNGKYERHGVNGIAKGLTECKAQYVCRVEPDIVKSVEMIEENVGNKVTCFSYPYGAYEEYGKEILVNSGIKFAFGTRYGIADFKGQPYHLNRLAIEMKTELHSLLGQEKEDIYGKGTDMYYYNWRYFK